ncbi:hypothetical protein P152DRAFT_502489 [Eremomyces bilateralis CBS 781.70]|uniref:Uncharacterized protein n=1 Tax=Eremomyces bilateralis CBS 781.70 TaxID=1392243 RepID=A0A6G1G5Y1_9PEZI|nr:uncharacterized protein P152DRAFT_502489 [Eremomyces bilateralis CBS 781.70]KAF1813280.1 hypothetical protein P152DRAFT_502489 [Eremomyces bilateralis CBS 781.70]
MSLGSLISNAMTSRKSQAMCASSLDGTGFSRSTLIFNPPSLSSVRHCSSRISTFLMPRDSSSAISRIRLATFSSCIQMKSSLSHYFGPYNDKNLQFGATRLGRPDGDIAMIFYNDDGVESSQELLTVGVHYEHSDSRTPQFGMMKNHLPFLKLTPNVLVS